MKTVGIALIVVVILGVGILFTEQFWKPAPVVTVPDGMSAWNWVYTPVSAHGVQFMYPDPLPTTYVHAQEWPPAVEVKTGTLSCAQTTQRSYNGHAYCATITRDGAAGSTYTTYDYSAQQGTYISRITFTLRTPQCMNYDQPQQGACTLEQSNINVDALVDRIASSIRMQ